MASDTVSASDIRIRARLFGSFLIEGDGLSSAPLGRKARAIIAYLLLSEREMVARERLAALLWGDRGEEQARASLHQTLYELRAYARGSPFVEIRRHDVRLVAKAVTTDLEALQALADGADAQAVATLIGDPPGVLLEDCDGINEAFDDWMAVDPRFMIVAARQELIDVWRRTNRWPDFCGDPHLAYDCRKVATGLTEKLLADAIARRFNDHLTIP